MYSLLTCILLNAEEEALLPPAGNTLGFARHAQGQDGLTAVLAQGYSLLNKY